MVLSSFAKAGGRAIAVAVAAAASCDDIDIDIGRVKPMNYRESETVRGYIIDNRWREGPVVR